MPSYRFIFLTACAILMACTGYAALVLSMTCWAEARQLDIIFPFYKWRIQPFSAATYDGTRAGLALATGLLAALMATLLASARSRRELAALGRELQQSWRSLGTGLRGLTSTQQRQALLAFAGLSALRLYFSLYNPEYDDAVSYEVFVSKGLLATSAYYPIPNNHVFSNTISLLFYQVSHGFWWSMRLPVLLISTGATIFLFAALRRWVGFRVAAVAVFLFSTLQLSLYHAGVGRGYWLEILLAGMVFFCALELTRPAGRARAAWAGLLVAGVLGCYTVPPFVYVLASAFSWLGLAALHQRQGRALLQLLLGGLLVGLSASVLYTPLVLVSGLGALVGNGYVAALAPARFWPGLPVYLWFNEGFLAGHRTVGALLTVPVLALAGWLLYLAQAGRLPRLRAQRLRHVGLPALWFVGLPYAVIIVQRVFPPERVMLYKAFFFFILVGLVLDWLLDQWPTLRWARPLLGTATGLFVAYQTYLVERINPHIRSQNAAYRAGLHWLENQPLAPTLVPEPTHNLFFRFYAHSEQLPRPWRFDNEQQPHTHYAYVVAFPDNRGFFKPEFPFPPAYHNAQVDIYVMPKDYRLATQTWLH